MVVNSYVFRHFKTVDHHHVTEPQFVVTCSLSQPWQTIRPGARSQRGETGVRRRQRWIYNSSPSRALLQERQLWIQPISLFSRTLSFCVQVWKAACVQCVCERHVRACVSAARACDKPSGSSGPVRDLRPCSPD